MINFWRVSVKNILADSRMNFGRIPEGSLNESWYKFPRYLGISEGLPGSIPGINRGKISEVTPSGIPERIPWHISGKSLGIIHPRGTPGGISGEGIPMWGISRRNTRENSRKNFKKILQSSLNDLRKESKKNPWMNLRKHSWRYPISNSWRNLE